MMAPWKLLNVYYVLRVIWWVSRVVAERRAERKREQARREQARREQARWEEAWIASGRGWTMREGDG